MADGGIANIVATHYNNRQQDGQEGRKESRIIHMRNFNNWIKSMLIAKALEKIRKGKVDYKAPVQPLVVLDIGCGKGGDLKKYKIGRISHLICTDIASTSLDQCKERYDCMWDYAHGNLFSCEFIEGDATKDDIHLKFKTKDIPVDLVSAQFAFHYSFESLEQAEQMIRNVSRNLKTGGFFIGTTPDANELVKRAREAEKVTFGNQIYSVSFPNTDVLDEDKGLPLFGAEYNFHLEGSVDCPEFLVYFPVLVQICKKYRLALCLRKTFPEFYDERIATKEGRDLIDRMDVFESFPSPNRRNCFSQDQYEHVNEELGKHFDTMRSLSLAEWEALTIYLVFAFQKMDRDL